MPLQRSTHLSSLKLVGDLPSNSYRFITTRTYELLRGVTSLSEKQAAQLVGIEVIESRGSKIGKVKEVVLDTSSWQVKALEIDLFPNVADELGLKRFLRKSQVQINVGDVSAVADTVLLKLSKTQLQALVSGAKPTEEPLLIEETAE